MSLAHRVKADDSPSTVFTVLGRTARAHSRRYLATEGLLAIAVATLVIAWRPQWWPFASLAGAVCLYATWGLIARDRERRVTRWRTRFGVAVAAFATAATLLGIGGLGVKAFTGSAPGPYGTCYHRYGRAYACHSDGSPRPVSHA